MTKRAISLILAFALIFGSFNFVSASSDIHGHWAEQNIKYLLDKGVVEGYPNGEFVPNKQITRAEFVAIINRTLALNEVGVVEFEDVTENDWFYKDIGKAMAAGYIEGYSKQAFKPRNIITREEAATIIGKAFGLEESDTSTIDFTDGQSIQGYAVGYVNAAANKGYISGYPNGHFSPQGKLTRAEAATIVFKIMTVEEIPEVPEVPNPGPRPVDPKPDPEPEEPIVTGNANIQLWKDNGKDRVDFDLIKDSFHIKNIATGEEFGEGAIPWNIKNAYEMSDIPPGEYTIHFDLPEGLYVENIELGESYNKTIYDPEENPLVIEDLGSNSSYASINIRSNTLLKEIRELNITLPKDTTYEAYLEMRPNKTIVVDENDVEYEVDVRFSPNKVQYENGREKGTLRVQSQSTITLPLNVSNTIPPMRSYAYLNITFEESKEIEKGQVHFSLFKDSTSSSNKIDFENITNVYIKNKETGEQFHEGKRPIWNTPHAFQMDDIPIGEYTIHFEMPEGMDTHEIQLGETYKETIYNEETNPLVVTEDGTSYVKIILKTDLTLQEIKSLEDLKVPVDITYDEFREVLPKQATIIDSEGGEHEVDLSWDIRPANFDNWNKPGEYTIRSEFFKLPINVSNSDPATRLEVKLKVIFEESTEPYIESVIHDVNSNGDFYRLYNYKNIPEPDNRWGTFYKLTFKFKDGTEYVAVGNPVKISSIQMYKQREAEEIESFDVAIYHAGGQFGPYIEILTIADVPFAGPNHERRAIFAAATAVGKAEKAKNADNLENAILYLEEARPIVNALPDGPDKEGLLERIQKVQDWIDEKIGD